MSSRVSVAARLILTLALAIPTAYSQPRSASAVGTVSFSILAPAGWSAFRQPKQVDVAPDGSIWVTDNLDQVVYKLGADGALRLILGSNGVTGTGNDRFSNPWGIAVTPDGLVYVADRGNKRIQVFNQTGEYLDTIGSSVNTMSPVPLVTPVALDADASGNVFAYDAGAKCVYKITPAGQLASDWSTAAAGTLSAVVQDLCVDSDIGRVYLLDAQPSGTVNRYVRVLGSDGSMLASWGATSTGLGINTNAFGIGVQGSNVYVAEAGATTPRIQRVNKADGSVVGTWTAATGLGLPWDIAFAPDGTAITADSATGAKRLRRWTGYDGSPVQTAVYGATAGTQPGRFSRPLKAAEAPDGSLWIADTDNRRIERFSASGQYSGVLTGYAETTFSTPTALAFDELGNLIVGDAGSASVVSLSVADGLGDLSASLVETISTGTIGTPADIEVSGDGSVLVADSVRNCVHVYDGGSYSRYPVDDTSSTAAGDFSAPSGIAISADGKVWVADSGNNRIQRFGTGWVHEFSTGTLGTSSNQYNSPADVEVATDGRIWVADPINNRVHVLASNGVWSNCWPNAGTTAGVGTNQFNAPRGIVTLSAGGAIVVDTGNNRLMMADDAPPVTTVSSVPLGWSAVPVQLSLQAADLSTPTTSYYALNGGAYSQYSGSFSVSTEGTNTISYYSTDRFGWTEETRTATVLIDLTSPEITSSSTASGWAREATLTVEATDALSGLDSVSWSLGEGESSAYSGPVSITQEGETTFKAVAADRAGHLTETSTPVRIDRTPPTPSVTFAAGDEPSTLRLHFDAEDGLSGVDSVEWCIDGGPVQSYEATVCSVLGSHSAEVWATDAAGNVSDHEFREFAVTERIPIEGSGFTVGDGRQWFSSFALGITSDMSGAEDMRFAVDGVFGDWQPYQEESLVILPPLDGLHELVGEYRNLSGTVESTTCIIGIDTEAPVTTCSEQSGAWLQVPAHLALSATDLDSSENPGSGVSSMFYSVNGGDAIGGNSVDLTEPGTYTVEYWSVDAAANHESPRSVVVHVGPQPTRVLVTSRPATVVDYSSAVTTQVVTFQLESMVTSLAASAKPLWLQRKLTYPSGSAWSTVATMTTGETGIAQYAFKPTDSAEYRAVFGGDSQFGPSVSGGPVAITVKAKLTRPVMSSTVYRNRSFTVYSLLSPKHTGASKVQFKFYRYENRRWVRKKTVTGRFYSYSSTATKVQLKTSLPSAGKWRVYAYHPGDTHPALTSTYKSVTVR